MTGLLVVKTPQEIIEQLDALTMREQRANPFRLTTRSDVARRLLAEGLKASGKPPTVA